MSVPEFETLDELWLDAAQAILQRGLPLDSRDGQTLETLGYSARLTDPRANFMLNPERKLSPAYAGAELLWYLSGHTNIDRIVAYAKQYTRFTEDGKTAFGAYGNRWRDHDFQAVMLSSLPTSEEVARLKAKYGSTELPAGGISQLHTLIWLLEKKPQTRQAVMAMWRPADLAHAFLGGKNDLPCTTGMIFMVRGGKLYLSVNMRSQDIWLGLPYDVWCFTCIQQLVAEALGLEVGWYHHNVMSLHVYERNEGRFRSAASPPNFNTDTMKYTPMVLPLFDSIAEAISLEQHNAEFLTCANAIQRIGQDSLLGQAVVMAALKFSFSDKVVSRIANPTLRRYVDSYWSPSALNLKQLRDDVVPEDK